MLVKFLPCVLASRARSTGLHSWPFCLCSAQAIDAFRPSHRLLEKPLRMPVTDVLRRWGALCALCLLHTDCPVAPALPCCCLPIHLTLPSPSFPACSGKAGVTVGGKLESGALRVGSRVLLMPSGLPATVK